MSGHGIKINVKLLKLRLSHKKSDYYFTESKVCRIIQDEIVPCRQKI